MKMYILLPVIAQLVISLSIGASEISQGEGGSIVLDDGLRLIKYEDVVGTKDGVYRGFILVNGAPALLTSGESDIVYTLKASGGKIFIDCAIAEARSNQTGLSIRKSMCGIGKELWPDYAELGCSFTDQWKEESSRIDISQLVTHKRPLDIVEGRVGEVEIHELYRTLSQLENAAPVTYLKKNNECYDISSEKTFVGYTLEEPSKPIGISILVDAGDYEFKSYKAEELDRLSYKSCGSR